MKWSSSVSDSPSLDDAVAACASDVREELGGQPADLTVVFVSAHHASGYDRLPDLVRRHIGDSLLVGCSGGGVIGAGREIEDRPGLALTCARLPEVELTPFHVENEGLPDGDAPPQEWEDLVATPARPGPGPHFILLADPFSVAADKLVEGLDFAFPTSAKIGGLASGAQQPLGNALFLADRVHDSGAVGVSMRGDIDVDTVVAQGCRPIGEPMRVTSCSGHVLRELDERACMEALQEVFEGLTEPDQRLAQHSLFLGVVMDPLNDSPGPGDFLVRNIIGANQDHSSLVIGEVLREGQTVQFHLRDAETSAQDLDAMLAGYAAKNPIYEETGALLFSCLGRGMHLYGRADHDTDMFRTLVSPMPLTGFFCNGEIGPVGGSTYLHGYTSAFGIFRPRRGSEGSGLGAGE